MFIKRANIPTYIVMYLFAWTIINLVFLSSFPFMHTDEAWLAGLSRAMISQRTPSATEPFFDLYRRAPHAVKIIYHFLQVIFIKIGGYSLFSVRLLSLTAGTLSLAVFSGVLKKLRFNPLPGMVLLSVQIQFIYASHFGRQEIFILLLMLLSINATLSEKHTGFKKGLLCGLPLAAAAGIHPNAFIAAWPPAVLLLTGIIRRKRSPTEGAGFLAAAGGGAVIFFVLSLLMNRGFVSYYGSFGAEVGFFDPLDVKALGFDDFYRKLFLRVSGTYYTPRIIPVFIAAGAGLITAVVRGKNRRKTVFTALGLGAAVNLGIILIGKYSQPSVLFVIPFLVILIVCGAGSIGKKGGRIFFAAAGIILLINSIQMIHAEIKKGNENYSSYLSEISQVVPQDAVTLGGLQNEFHFNSGRLRDWRNLAFLNKAGIDLEDYILKNGIEYIIYAEELDFIYENRPVWNILYGNIFSYYEELNRFISESCVLEKEFTSPGYGSRISMYRNRRDWKVRIYRTK